MPKKERELYGLDIEHRISQLQKCEMSKKNSNYSGSLNEATHFSSFRGKIGYKMIPF